MHGSSAAKRHHYIPRWHLKRFAANPNKPRLWVFAKSRDTFYETAIINAAVIGQYYRWDTGGEYEDIVERGLAALDARAAEILPKFERGRPLEGTEPNVVAAYLATQRVRVPVMRENAQKLIEAVGARGAEEELASQDKDEVFARALAEGRVKTREEFDQLQQDMIRAIRERTVKVTMEPIMNFSFQMQGVERLAWFIEDMAWLVVEAAPGSEFVISDNPVTLRSSAPALVGWPPGFGDPDVEVAMPLSRRAMFMVSHDHRIRGRAGAVRSQVLELNRRAWEDALEYVYASSREVLEEVAATFKDEDRCKPGGRIDFAWDERRQSFLPRAS